MTKAKSITLVLYLIIFSCQDKTLKDISLKNLNENKPYLIFRGTDTKHGFLARDFNIKDSINSHVGILLHDKNWIIYNVSDFEKSKSALQAQTINEFKICDDGKVTSISIWDFNSENNNKSIILSEIKKLMKSKITFDKFFDFENNNLYCSEFVVDILKNADSNMIFKPVKRELKGIYKTYFRKDTLEYYPVDIFQNNNNIKKINQWNLAQ